MGHHHREEYRLEPKSIDPVEKSGHPFFETNDLTLLSLIVPLLSESGKQMISFLINFGSSKPFNSMVDPVNLLKQLAPKIEDSPLKDFLPLILTFLAGSDNKNRNFNPALLSSLFANLNQKKEEE